MTSTVIARRYAAALFDVVSRSGAADQAGEELVALRDLVLGHADLRKLFETPMVPARRKRAVAQQLVKALAVTPYIERLVLMLADRNRLMLIPDIATAYTDRLMKAHKVLPAEIVTAVPLNADRRQALAQSLGRATGGEIRITERVDPSIIGGVVARVGSVVFDGSVTTQLKKLREQLKTTTTN